MKKNLTYEETSEVIAKCNEDMKKLQKQAEEHN